jgi:Uma2 family endonuclease
VKRPALLTEEEFLQLPEIPGKQELLGGELVELPPAGYSHAELARRMFELLYAAVGRGHVWIASAYRLGPENWTIPDVSVSWPDQPIKDDWFQKAPMIAIEVASRGNTPEQLEKKRLLYLEGGAAEVWLIYPQTRSMLVSRTDGTVAIGPDANYECRAIGVTVMPEYRTPVR